VSRVYALTTAAELLALQQCIQPARLAPETGLCYEHPAYRVFDRLRFAGFHLASFLFNRGEARA
jgi:hypothetical protein